MKKYILGLITGFANGLFGSGGGTLLVPGMEKYLGIEEHKAHATAIAVILPLSVLSAFLYLRGVDVDYISVIKVSAGGIAGGWAGARLLGKISGKYLHIIFGLFMIGAAVRMIL